MHLGGGAQLPRRSRVPGFDRLERPRRLRGSAAGQGHVLPDPHGHRGIVETGGPRVVGEDPPPVGSDGGQLLRRVALPLRHHLLEMFVDVGPEDPLEEILAGVGGADEDVAEAPLRNDHHAAEVVGGEAGDRRHPLGDLADLGGDRLPLPGPGAGGGVPAMEGGGRRLGGGAATALLARVLRIPRDAVALPADDELEAHLGELIGPGPGGAQLGSRAAVDGSLALTLGRGLAEEGVADRVEEGGLAGAGGAGKEKQAGRGKALEVDRLGTGERSEAADREPVESHRPAPAAIAASMHSRAKRDTAPSAASP